MSGNLAMSATGSGDFILSRKDNNDFGHGGHGFWFQGPGIAVVNNIAAATRGGAFIYLTSSSKDLFDAVNLTDPALAAGRVAVPVGTVPIKQFEGNTAYGSQSGIEIWFHQTMLTDGESVIKDFKAWNIQVFGVDLQYSGHVTIRNATLLGDMNSFSGLGVMTNRLTHDIVADNVRAEGFGIGIQAAARRTTQIKGGYLNNIQNILIEKGQDTIRSVTVRGPVYVKPTAEQLRGRQYFEIYASGQFNFNSFLDRKIESLFSTDVISIATAFGAPGKLVYYEQAASYVPFPSASSQGFVPNQYLNKTNQQLKDEFGISFGGEVSAANLIQLPNVFGLLKYR
jgi:hypothetical protein